MFGVYPARSFMSLASRAFFLPYVFPQLALWATICRRLRRLSTHRTIRHRLRWLCSPLRDLCYISPRRTTDEHTTFAPRISRIGCRRHARGCWLLRGNSEILRTSSTLSGMLRLLLRAISLERPHDHGGFHSARRRAVTSWRRHDGLLDEIEGAGVSAVAA